MIKLTRQEIALVKKHLKIITTIITNHSCSFITPEFRQDIKTIAENHKLDYCDTCNAGLFNTCTRVYNAYNTQMNKKSQK